MSHLRNSRLQLLIEALLEKMEIKNFGDSLVVLDNFTTIMKIIFSLINPTYKLLIIDDHHLKNLYSMILKRTLKLLKMFINLKEIVEVKCKDFVVNIHISILQMILRLLTQIFNQHPQLLSSFYKMKHLETILSKLFLNSNDRI